MLHKRNNYRDWAGRFFARGIIKNLTQNLIKGLTQTLAKVLTIGFALCLTMVFSINTTQCASHQNSNINNRSDKTKSSFIQELQTTYASHKKTFVKFDLKGKYNSKDFFYTGTITGIIKNKGLKNNATIKIKILDAVFLSLLYTIHISSESVTVKNHVTGEKQTVDTRDFNIVEIFGSGYPFHFLLPMMLGQLPQELFSSKARVNIDKQNIKYSNREYEIIAKFSNSRLNDIYYHEKSSSTISVFVFRGKLKKPVNTPYPRTIFISNNKTKDNVTLIFKKVIVK